MPRPSPALVVSLVALFFALGGTAFAVGSKELASQPRCATGAIRGVAVINAGPTGLDALTATYSSAPGLFGYHWSCGGGKIMVRKPTDFPGVEIKFVGNSSSTAIVSSVALGVPYSGSVSRMPDGSFRVTMGGSNAAAGGPWQPQIDVPFMIVLL
ncbi:MAG TPA: hypothetical protein VNC40_01945 [Gaiellaceae bacterium]|nr:hypothetical protein [Gaiellaceae bacterium]